MGNRVSIESTIFTNPVTQAVSHGYRVYDDYCSGYGNGMEPDEIVGNGVDILRNILNGHSCEELDGALDFVQVYEVSIYINDEEFTYDEIKDLVNA